MVTIRKIYIFILSLFIFISYNSIHVSALYTTTPKKTVYLTFDDGPSVKITKDIIDILKANNIKGTFFVVGDYISIYPYLLEELENSNMSIMPHCNYHDYKALYKNEEAYFTDLNKCISNIKKVIGDKKMNFVRLPGGADNTYCEAETLKKIKSNLLSKDINYIDWTIDTGDSESYDISKDYLISRIRDEGCLYDVEVVLMHDLGGKNTTVEALQGIIDIYKEKGYEFKTLNYIEDQEIEYLKKINVLNK
ncbi:polysaccharide deacetylase [Clostridium sartagoforme]|uniref:Polysaccharide deacetylase n=1 Tax=Clostridium sartagoforme TaxID=84031 RepID=A0A4V3RL02_9CLOT|nr:polysaccharide deacetylase family protein [Clostridium sartagoforme]TGY41900.1 polysaccharide deacetylase [Clostridium sartagoforme]